MDRRTFIKSTFYACCSYLLPSFAFSQEYNPYLLEFNKLPSNYKHQFFDLLGDNLEQHQGSAYRILRQKLVHKYSWAVPNDTAIKTIADFVGNNSVCDFGAGSGYWASLLSRRGVGVVCIDNWTDPKPKHLFHHVQTGSFDLLREHVNKTLMLVWPPKATVMGVRAIQEWGGNKLVYVGEPGMPDGTHRGTADISFFIELGFNWDLVKTIAIPNWFNRNDAVYLYTRKA